MTFSVLGRCARTGQLGIAIASSSIAVAARCAHVRARVGVVASQNITNPALGPAILRRLGQEHLLEAALSAVMAAEPHRDYRQVLALDAAGHGASYAGAGTLGLHAQAVGRDCLAGGNLLHDPGVPAAMVVAFEGAAGHLGDRLVAALAAGLAAGGEAGPVYSAGLKIADTLDWPIVDLRVDWSDEPVAGLGVLWQLYRPQMAAYVQRAVQPDQAPSFGVPGDR